MGCSGNNATPPSPAIAPGGEHIDPAAVAERIGRHGVDPRLPSLVPGFDAPFFQAGLAGYSDPAMRLIARDHGCPLCVTEALLDRTLLAGGRGFAKADLGDIAENVPGGADDHPLVGQIMGSDPATMADAAVKMIEQGARSADPSSPSPNSGHRTFVTIDINLACPVKKIARKARGGHFLAHPEDAVRVLAAVRDALPASVPLTVKIRRSYDDTPEMVRSFWHIFDATDDLGCAWVTVHGRTVAQKYIGPSRWDLLREIVHARPERLVFGSGDVWNASDIFRMIGYTGVAAASVARGCIGNPWIFRQAREMLAGRDPAPPTLCEQRAVLERHFELALRVNRRRRDPEQHTAREMRKFAIRFAAHHPAPERVRRRFIETSSLDEWQRVLTEEYDAHEPASL